MLPATQDVHAADSVVCPVRVPYFPAEHKAHDDWPVEA